MRLWRENRCSVTLFGGRWKGNWKRPAIPRPAVEGARPSCFAALRCETSPTRGLRVAGVGYPEGSAQNSRGKWVKQA